MENRKPKIFISIMIILLCLSVSIGLTYAYFVDSAKSSGNKIQSGSLKLDLQLYDKVDGWQSIKNSEAPIFNYDKWEPGYVDAKLLKIENLGALAMQWEAKLVSSDAVSEFADSIEIYTKTSNTEMAYPASRAEALTWNKLGTLDQFINTAEKLASGTFMTKGEAFYIGIVLYMPVEITNNDLQGQLLGAFDIQINATQLAYESDAFDEKYDEDAKLPCDHLSTEVILGECATPTFAGTTDGLKCLSCGEILIERKACTEGIEYDKLLNAETYRVRSVYNCIYDENGVETGVTDIVIAPRYNDGVNGELPVAEIESSDAFGGYPVTSVIIPNTFTVIGSWWFSNCTELRTFIIPSSIESIHSQAFSYCENLTEIIFEGTVAQWNAIYLDEWWNDYSAITQIICSDGVVTLN